MVWGWGSSVCCAVMKKARHELTPETLDLGVGDRGGGLDGPPA